MDVQFSIESGLHTAGTHGFNQVFHLVGGRPKLRLPIRCYDYGPTGSYGDLLNRMIEES